jgi:hypothetical protein
LAQPVSNGNDNRHQLAQEGSRLYRVQAHLIPGSQHRLQRVHLVAQRLQLRSERRKVTCGSIH